MLKVLQEVVNNVFTFGTLFVVFSFVAVFILHLRTKSEERKDEKKKVEKKFYECSKDISFYVNINLSYPDNNWDKLWEGLLLEAFNKIEFPNLEMNRHLEFVKSPYLKFDSGLFVTQALFTVKRTKIPKDEEDLANHEFEAIKVFPQNKREQIAHQFAREELIPNLNNALKTVGAKTDIVLQSISVSTDPHN